MVRRQRGLGERPDFHATLHHHRRLAHRPTVRIELCPGKIIPSNASTGYIPRLLKAMQPPVICSGFSEPARTLAETAAISACRVQRLFWFTSRMTGRNRSFPKPTASAMWIPGVLTMRSPSQRAATTGKAPMARARAFRKMASKLGRAPFALYHLGAFTAAVISMLMET